MKDLNQPININITTGTILKSALVVLFVWFLFIIKDLLLIILTAIVIASSVEPGTRWFISKKIPRTLAVLLIYLLVVVFFGAVFYFFVPTLISDINSVVTSLPEYIKSIAQKAGQISQVDSKFLKDFAETYSNASADDIFNKIGSSISGATFSLISALSTVFGGLFSFILIIVLSFYLAVQDDGVSSFLRIVVPARHEKYALDLWKRSQSKIGLWMQGQLVLGVLVGVLTFLGLSILGIPNALFLAFLAGMFELIPMFGPILAAIPAVIFAISGGFTTVLFVIALYAIIQQFESQLIHPLVVKKIVGIPSIIAIIALIIGAQIAGFLGMVLSVPVASIIMEYFSDVEKRKALESKED